LRALRSHPPQKNDDAMAWKRRPGSRRARGLCAFAAGLALAAGTARADEARPILLALTQGTLTYTVVHKLHEVKGTSRKLEGLARVQPGAATLVQVRAPIASFDSGNSNRDVHMREATHEPAHPNVEVKGTLPPIALPLQRDEQLGLDARVELNGVVQRQSIAVTLSPEGTSVRARFSFPISIESFGIERPELLLIKVEDRAIIQGDVLFEERK